MKSQNIHHTKLKYILLSKIPFVIADATDCPKQYQEYSAMNDELKSMIEIKPDILRDVTIIIEKFSCNSHYILVFLEDFVSNFSATIVSKLFFSLLKNKLLIFFLFM